jgi:glycosyltransferase involved in cell wall biosynthesis
VPADGALTTTLREAGVEVQVRPLAVLRRSLMSPRGISRVAASWAADAGGLGRMARSREIALVHTNTSVTLGGAAVARIAGVPHVWHVREIYAGFERWFPAYRRLLLTADALPCVSEATVEQFDADPAAMTIYDGLAVAPRRAPRDEARAALGLPPDAFVVAVLGRISGWKGQDVAVHALAQLPENAVLLVAGQPWRGEERHLRELQWLAHAHNLADRVVHAGFVDDVSLVYGAADVIAVPSKQPDPLPNAAIEAAAAGCCVVGSAHGGLPEILRDGETGLLVPPGDPAALAAAIAGADRERLGAAAAADVAQRFDPKRMLDEVQALYDTLLA